MILKHVTDSFYVAPWTDGFYVAPLSASEQTHCALPHATLNELLLYTAPFEYPPKWYTYSTV